MFKLNTATAPAFSRSSKPLDSLKLLGMAGVSRSVPNIGALIIRIGSWGPLHYILILRKTQLVQVIIKTFFRKLERSVSGCADHSDCKELAPTASAKRARYPEWNPKKD